MFNPSLIAAVDIGSPSKGNLGWAVLPDGETGKPIRRLAELVCEALNTGPVALGFECPLWVPMRGNEQNLLSPRSGDGKKAWSAKNGPYALVTGLGVIPFGLRSIRKMRPDVKPSFDWRNPPSEPGTILFWEAFVAGREKGRNDEEDALIAARAFSKALDDLDRAQKLTPETGFNLLGAALLRLGWTKEVSVIASDILVVGP